MKQRPSDLMGRNHVFEAFGCRCDVFAYVARSGRHQGYMSIWSSDGRRRLGRLPIPGEFESVERLADAGRHAAGELMRNLGQVDQAQIGGPGQQV